MSEKIKLRISPVVAAFVRPDLRPDEKLKGLDALVDMAPEDRVLLLFCLMKDADNLVKDMASTFFEAMPAEDLLAYIIKSDPHPAVLDQVARFHHATPAVVAALLESNALSPPARAYLDRVAQDNNQPVSAVPIEPDAAEHDKDVEDTGLLEELPNEDEDQGNGNGESGEGEPEELDEEGEEFVSKYRMAQSMGIADKIKMALTGDKEWRSILIKDANKLVSAGVIKNPRITESEVLNLVKSGVQNDEIMRLICSNKEWIKNLKIRKALVENPRTPVPSALRFLSTLGEKDVAAYAKSKNISSVISTQAKRILMSKKR